MTDPANQGFLVGSLDRLAAALNDRKNPQGTVHRTLQKVGSALKWLTIGYAILLVLLLIGLEWFPERYWLLSFFLFVPAQMWLLPLAPLTPVCLLFRPKLAWIHLGCSVLVLYFFMDFRISGSPRVEGPELTLMTNNTGENAHTSLAPFIKLENPDFVAMEDSVSYAMATAREFPDMVFAQQDQFALLSKYPIKNSGVVPILTHKQFPVAAWFEVDCRGQTIIIYAVHMLSPRANLEGMKGVGFFAALFGREGRHGSRLRLATRDFWEEQVRVASALAEYLKKETRPFLVCGDFNVPDHGGIYHTFASEWTDAFAARGNGYGFSFPGYTRNPMTGFGPWLRLDQIWSPPAFRPVYCRVEPGRKSQHRAVVARFEVKIPAK
jgi:endonuclease/exonuclease/phosphatase (EEP) superfamily protein YafD